MIPADILRLYVMRKARSLALIEHEMAHLALHM